MNDLIRPTFYDAHHEIRPLRDASPAGARLRADVVGPVCESGDYLALDRDMPELARAIGSRSCRPAPMARCRRGPTIRGC